MKYIIISGSNRDQSGSRKVSNYIEHILHKDLKNAVVIFDMHIENIPMWTEDMWNKDSDQYKNWQNYSQELQDADAVIVVAAEWAGSIPVSLRNFLLHTNTVELGHKPALLVSVSAGQGGSNPIAELRAFSVKNNHMVYIPDHVIVRDVSNILNNFDINPELKNETWIKERIIWSLGHLELYAKNLGKLRTEIKDNLQDYPNGMS